MRDLVGMTEECLAGQDWRSRIVLAKRLGRGNLFMSPSLLEEEAMERVEAFVLEDLPTETIEQWRIADVSIVEGLFGKQRGMKMHFDRNDSGSSKSLCRMNRTRIEWARSGQIGPDRAGLEL